jgi:cholesterol transport system auxiliary component
MRAHRIATLVMPFVAMLLGACAVPGASEPQVRSFDLGLDIASARRPDARLGQVRGSPPFDVTDMQYRLAYRNAAELHSFAQSRWAAAPAELLRKRLVRTLESGTTARCTFDLEVNEFTQVFSAGDASEALVEVRILLANASGRIAEKTVRVTATGAGGSAQQGVAAIARATDDAIGRIADWINQQTVCQTR